MSNKPEMDRLSVNVIKGLIMDAIRKANSGHPGGAMSSSDFAYVLFKDILRVDPGDPAWFNRDRFVLSAGHESALLYAILTFQGLLDVEDLKAFRQWRSRTPGHPECHVTPGVEATGGPLGQGFGMAVGMAVAEAMLRARLGADVCDHFTYALAGDGDLQEPVCLGSASLAGLWGLGKLIVYYDSNKVQLAGPTCRCDSTDYAKLFESLAWHVQEIDGHDHEAIRTAVKAAQLVADKPSLIIGHTTMAMGTATREGDYTTHGSPLPQAEIEASKKKLGLPADQSFRLPQDVLDHFRARFPEQKARAAAWKANLDKRLASDMTLKTLWTEIERKPAERAFTWPAFKPGDSVAIRGAWGKCLVALGEQFPLLVGGSADLDSSNQTEAFRDRFGIFHPETPLGRGLCFGVREFPMGTIVNGIALHGGLVSFGATFLTFSDYERNALRMSALQHVPALHVFTHDTYHVGEDGPTHQPIEQLSSLRLIPNMLVLRPADANETALAVEIALTQDTRPSCLVFAKQNLPVLDPTTYPGITDGARRGGYILREAPGGKPDLVLLASGSEVHLALAAAEALTERRTRVVNMVSLELFEEQPAAYKARVLAPDVPARVAVEAGRGDLWYRYVGMNGLVVAKNDFGDSAPAAVLSEHYGFTPEALTACIREYLRKE